MSFRSAEGSQHRDAGAAATKQAAFLVLQGNGFYTVDTTGPADAYLGAGSVGFVTIDAAATEHALGARIVKVGNFFRIF